MNEHLSDASSPDLPSIVLPATFNYIAAFLTFACTLHCSYCINRFGELKTRQRKMTGNEWLSGLNRIVSRSDLPITLQGGEPTQHPDFCQIVNGIRPELNIDLLTNLEFDIHDFMKKVPSGRIRRDALYASIRVSYHPETMQIEPLAAKVVELQKKGYSIGIWGVDHPQHTDKIAYAQDYCALLEIDFRTKEFLGEYNEEMYGSYGYPGACDRIKPATVLCRPSELLIAPDGFVYRCHGDLYEAREPIGHLLESNLCLLDEFRECRSFGYCNPCDVKVKTNRFQQFGHTSVEIIFP